MTERENFSGQVPPLIIDDEYRNCNFSQPQPLDVGGLKRGVVIFEADTTPRTFVDCNMTNCEPPPGSICTNCNLTIAERNVATTTETVTIDGEDIVLQHHSNFIHGHYDSVAETYRDLDTPREDVED